MFLNTFSKTHRVLEKEEFQTVMKKGKRYFVDSFVLFSHKNHKAHHRLGVIASRKSGNAVVRNRAKRVMREYFRTVLKHRIQTDGYDFVFICKRNIGAVHLKDIYGSMNKIYDKNTSVVYSGVSERALRAAV